MRKRVPAVALTIPEPCQQDWRHMDEAGPGRRHCSHCRTDVVDVALLTEVELRSLLQRTGGAFCARLTQREDGSLLLRAPELDAGTLHVLRGAPFLAGAMLAGSALPVLAQRQPHPPAISCTEISALDQKAAEPRIEMAPPAPASPPAPQEPGMTLGRIKPPGVPLHGQVHLPHGRTVRNGLVFAQDRSGTSVQMDVGQDGRFAGTLPRGRYTLRADVRADDGQLYATTDAIVVADRTLTRDLLLEGPVLVTAGAPVTPPRQK